MAPACNSNDDGRGPQGKREREMTAVHDLDRVSRERERLKAINVRLLKALEPFADFASDRAPRDLIITQGSHMAKRQRTMRDCQQAAAAIAKAGDAA